MGEKDQKPHRNLIAWQKGMDLVIQVYQLTQDFPASELYGLSSQLRRAAVSVPSNIAEGAANRTASQFAHFLANALGSLNELDTQMELCFRLGYLAENQFNQICKLLNECLALTYGLRKSITNKVRS